ncbi:MAG: hypothetical protein AAFX54_15025 [Pseudomonadota bacterium]
MKYRYKAKGLGGLSIGMLVACAPNTFQPSPDAFAPWTHELRAEQPDDAYAAIYDLDQHHIVFLGAKHANSVDSLTFQLIEQTYDAFDIDVVLIEGFPTAKGPNAARLIAYAQEADEEDGFQSRGETVPAVLGALDEGAIILGGEPDDIEIKASVLAQGFPEEDLLGFYTLRTIPQWIRQKKIEDAGDAQIFNLIPEELTRNRNRLTIAPTVLPVLADWLQWYEKINGKPLGEDFSTEEAGPLADGPYGSNRVAAAISRARAEHLHDLIIERANAGETVMIVFGASHFMIHRPAMTATFDVPCYIGADMVEAANMCLQ